MAFENHSIHPAGIRRLAARSDVQIVGSNVECRLLQDRIHAFGTEVPGSPTFPLAPLDPFDVVKKSLYCGGPSIRLSQWVGVIGPFSGYTESWPQLKDRTVIGTHRGRTAVALACRLLGLVAGDEILVPSYNCGTELDAVIYSGAKPVGYRITRRCEIDLEDLFSRRTNRTRAVYLIHYFGWEQPMNQLRAWCDEHGLLLIEDCALALFSTGQTGNIGRTGDAAIFSLPKSLGTLQGGLLTLSAPPKHGMPVMKPSGNDAWLREIRHSTRTAVFQNLEKLGIYGVLVSGHRRHKSGYGLETEPNDFPDMPDHYYFNPALEEDRALHPRTETILNTIPWQQEIRERRENYARLANALEGIRGGDFLFDELPPGVCPLSLPLLSPNRDRCVRILQAKGISAFPWWAGFHRSGLDWPSFPDACWLKHNVLTVPIYHGLKTCQCDKMAEIIADVLA